MTGTNSFIRVPPDSTGKKTQALQHIIDAEEIHVPSNHISCAQNPEHFLIIDPRGQAYMRSAEGSSTIDAWGNARTAEQNMLSAYDFSINGMDDLFTDFPIGGGQILHDAAKRCINLSVPSTDGAEAKRITNRYHYCLPGVGLNVVFSVMAGDAGKVGNKRVFGYGDENNGLFFALIDGTINIIVRSDATGTVQEILIPQDEWNGDKLDGTGVSAFTLDPTKIQLMFIDFSWLGTGIARFGCYTPDGSRWVCHTHNNAGASSFPFMASGSLPVFFENENTAATASGSEFFIFGATVYNSSVTNFTFWRFVTDSGPLRAVGTTQIPLLSLTSKLTLDDGRFNSVGLYPETLSVVVTGGTIQLKVVDDAGLTDPAWTDEHGSTSLIDRAATAMTGGEEFIARYLGPGTHEIDLRPFYELNDEGYCTLADGSEAYVMTIGAKTVEGTGVTVACSLNFRELR